MQARAILRELLFLLCVGSVAFVPAASAVDDNLAPTPDFMGRGLLVLLTPALLTLWLREMLAGIYILEKRYQDNPPTLAAHEAPAEGPAPPSRPSRGEREPPARRQ